MRWPRRHRGRHAAGARPRAVLHAATAVPDPRPAVEAAPAVLLGFTDGSSLELTHGDATAMALQAVADLLVQAGPRSADN